MVVNPGSMMFGFVSLTVCVEEEHDKQGGLSKCETWLGRVIYWKYIKREVSLHVSNKSRNMKEQSQYNNTYVNHIWELFREQILAKEQKEETNIG